MVGEVAESEGGTAEVFDPAVDGLGRSVRCAGSVEVGQDVDGPSGQGPAKVVIWLNAWDTPWLTASMTACMSWRPVVLSGSR